MLALTRKTHETVEIHVDGKPICKVLFAEQIAPGKIRLAFDAPPHVAILRQELTQPAAEDSG